MSSPIPSTSGSDVEDVCQSSVPNPTSALALSGLLRVQRRWSLASFAGLELGRSQAPAADDGELDGAELNVTSSGGLDSLEPTEWRQPLPGVPSRVLPIAVHSRLPYHLEDSEWSRLALGVASEALASLGVGTNADVLQLGPDSVTVHVPTSEPPQWPFGPGQVSSSWTLPRDSRIIASLPITPSITAAAGKAALVTLSELHGRRVLVDLVAVGSTLLKGPPQAVGTKIAEVAVELGSRRWSDLATLILVAFDRPMPRLAGTKLAPDIAAALEEVEIRSRSRAGPTSICVIVPPWASDPADPLLSELVRICEMTAGVGILCCCSLEGAMCLWELAPETTNRPILTFGNGRQIAGLDPTELSVHAPSSVGSSQAPGRAGAGPGPGDPRSPAPRQARERRSAPAPRNAPVEIAVLGNVQVNGAAESFRYRRRLTELVAFLAMHPEGTTTDAFATALWPERRVPLQTLANRLSETRRALGLASDGRPRLRKQGRRHLIVEAETDWDRFRELAEESRGPDAWRGALALVRGRPFEGLDRGEWAQLEGHLAFVEATVVGVACRLGEHALDRGEGGLAHWAALQGLLVSPWDERLYRLLMRAADGLGNRGGVDAALRSLAAALELEGDPLLVVHPETSALYRSLTSRSLT